MKVIKRNGSEVEFDASKIYNAIVKANLTTEGSPLKDSDIQEMTDYITFKCGKAGTAVTVEDIQDMVEDQLMAHGAFNVARHYVKYRYQRQLVRKTNDTDEKILSIIERENEEAKQENSNKNPVINSVQRDYMAGEISKDLSERLLLPENIVKAHKEGIIHFHDMDYFAQHMHNCFTKDTRFITDKGIRSFGDYDSGDKVTVRDKDGNWRKATVKCYGRQQMQIVVLSGANDVTTVKCTPDHRWILKDGTVTTSLKTGDSLYGPGDWKVTSITPSTVEYAWCVEEPVTHSFTLDKVIVTGNCDLVNLEDMLQNGTSISGTHIDKPHLFSTACNIAMQIVAQVASVQYGGQSISLAHLAPFVAETRKRVMAEVEQEEKDAEVEFSEEARHKIVERRVRKDIEKGVQTIQYQVITLMTTNGQAPFLTVFMYLNEAKNDQEKKDLALIIEEVLKQRILGVKNEEGVYITPAFPKLIYVLQEDNVKEGSEYFYLTELAAKCTAKRLVPDYISEKVMKELREGNCFPVMGCRSCLSPWKDENGNYKFYGRFNQGVVTINLPDVALSAKAKADDPDHVMNEFWKIFDERLELCFDALMCRHKRLLGTPSDAAPILWQNGALARLKKGEVIDPLLFNGYSTISLGYAGLAECVYALKGISHTSEEGMKLGLQIMEYMNKKCDIWKEKTTLGFGIYGTPLESTTYKFAKCLKKRFGVIKGVSDKNYITNSYHVRVTEKIDAFTKLALESKFQALSKGGAISYVEVPDMKDNIPAVISVIQFIYDNIMYAELNTKSDYCQVCGYDGEIQIVEDDGKLVWECPHCHNRDQSKMNVARRTCGYIGSQFWNQGRTQEIRDRVLHL